MSEAHHSADTTHRADSSPDDAGEPASRDVAADEGAGDSGDRDDVVEGSPAPPVSTGGSASPGPLGDDDVRDQLPDDLDAAGFVGPYQFPDNSRRRIPGIIYLVLAAGCVALYVAAGDSSPVVNAGFVLAAVLLAIMGVISITSGWRMRVDEKDALVAAQRAVGFAVGHASAQQVWHGVRSRPTWRVLCYSAEEPPHRRGLVLVDAVDGRVIEQLVEANPERWAAESDGSTIPDTDRG